MKVRSFESVRDRLDKISELKEGWDEDCALPVPQKLIKFAKSVLNEIEHLPVPEIGAHVDGSIDIDWIDYGNIDENRITIQGLKNNVKHEYKSLEVSEFVNILKNLLHDDMK